MVECVLLAWDDVDGFLSLLAERYGLLERIRSSADKQGVTVLGFGLADDACRLVLEGDEQRVANVIRGVRVGTLARARYRSYELDGQTTQRTPVTCVEDAVVWAHQATEHPGLASPWSSHRDLLGFRQAAFFDASAVLDRVDVQAVHRRVGGQPVPSPVEVTAVHGASVRRLMRIAGAVLGLLPSDRRTFALFIQLARACGWKTAELADALMVSKRRVRQLVHAPAQPVSVAMAALHDARLAVVP